MRNSKINRRRFVQRASCLLGGAWGGNMFGSSLSVKADSSSGAAKNRFCAFVKFVQELKPEQLAETLKNLGYDGGEVTVRPGGYITPENAVDKLPEVHSAFENHGLSIEIITTSITSPESPHAEDILRTAGELEVPFYRLGFCYYDLKEKVVPQLEGLRKQFDELAALNAQFGISGVYQNHSGPQYVGATFWDLQRLLNDIPRQQIGVIFDIRHACVEGGLAWPVYYNVIRPHIAAFSMKDFRWDGRKVKNVALGEGMVDPKFYAMVRKDFPDSLYSVHVEYLEKEGLQPNIAALKTDLVTLKSNLTESSRP